jgi:hypothetical protein
MMVWMAALVGPSLGINFYSFLLRESYSFIWSFVVGAVVTGVGFVPVGVWGEPDLEHLVGGGVVSVLVMFYLVVNSAWVVGRTVFDYSCDDYIMVAIRVYVNWLVIGKYMCVLFSSDDGSED